MCDFYLTERGCVKGDSCDFYHPTAPDGTVTKRVCTYYSEPRGCVKNQECNFLHIGPTPQQRMNLRPCQFYNSARGCIKGQTCEFAHVPVVGMGMQPVMQPYGYPPPPMHGMPSRGGGYRPVTRSKRPQICEFFNKPRGCIKGDACDFIHQKDQPCRWFTSERGCRKGDLCDFRHSTEDEKRKSVRVTPY